MHYGTLLGNEFCPSFLRNLVTANKRRDSVLKTPIIQFGETRTQSHSQTQSRRTGFVQSLEFLKKYWHLSCNFPDLGKVWKTETKTWKMGKSQVQQVLYKWICFCFGQILFNLAGTFEAHYEKSFLRFLKVSIDHLIDNLESGKRNYCSGKSLEKVLKFGNKNLYKPCSKKWSTVQHGQLEMLNKRRTMLFWTIVPTLGIGSVLTAYS